MVMKWICPICGNNAYQRFGGITLPAIKVDESQSPPKHEKTSYKMGQHFMCKGCSVFFSNPKLFNKVAVDERKLRQEIAERHSLIDMVISMDKEIAKALGEIKDEQRKKDK